MSKTHQPAFFFLLILLLSFRSHEPEQTVRGFKLINTDGKMVSLNDYPDAKGFIVIFTCNHCPFAKLYPPRFNEMQQKYKFFGVPVIAISSTDTIQYEEDSYIEMVKKARAENFHFPYLHDAEQLVAKDFKAQKTPHAYVIWKVKGKWVVKYNGAIDDNGAEPENVTEPYVTNAVDALLRKKKVKVSETKSIGCQIYFRKK